jgi:anti-sigma28 factor (negative regulator of flagellin synthesis)
MQDLQEESKTSAAVDESHCNLKEEDEAGMESFSERKTNTNPLPALKGNKNAMSAGNKVKAFSQRIINGSLQLDPNDIHGIANQMLFEINLVAGKMLIM